MLYYYCCSQKHWLTLLNKSRSLHCLIHQSLLCAKLSGQLKEAMDSVMAIVIFIRCLFHKLLTDMSAEYKDLLIHDIRNALKRFWEQRGEILLFIRSSKLEKSWQVSVSVPHWPASVNTACALPWQHIHLTSLLLPSQKCHFDNLPFWCGIIVECSLKCV